MFSPFSPSPRPSPRGPSAPSSSAGSATDWPQDAFLITIQPDGRRHLRDRIVADLRDGGLAAPVLFICLRMPSGPGPGRRIRRRRHLSWRSIRRQKARLADGMDSDLGAAGFWWRSVVCSHPPRDQRRRVRRLGLARAVPCLGRAADDFGVDPLRLQESPVFRKCARKGSCRKRRTRESFFRWRNLRTVLSSVHLRRAQGVIWYTFHFYVQTFLDKVLKVDQAPSTK